LKRIMTGNEAIARGAYEAGCKVAAAYPGTPSTEVLENIALYKEIYSQWSVNEKVALEVAGGASIAGARALCAMKHVGLNVAADPLFTLAYTGVSGGLVVVTADDPGLHSSQNEQDNRYYAIHAKVAMIEPSDSQECLDYVKYAFQLSEKYDIPVLFRVTTRICHSKSLVSMGVREDIGVKEYKKDVKKYCMVPAFGRERHVVVEQKLAQLREYSNESPLNRIEWEDNKIGIIAGGISYQHAREVMGDDASYLKIGLSFPLPEKLIREFAAGVEKLYVIEENEPYMETFVKSLGIKCIGKDAFPICGELNPEIIEKVLRPKKTESTCTLDISIPTRPPVLCAGCPHRGLFYALKKYKDAIVTGDIGCYSLSIMPPLDVTHTLICMGAGISAGIGFEKALMQAQEGKKVFGCMGDSTFFHSGITSLIDAVYNKSKMAVIILDNRITAMTGHQENPGTGKTLRGDISPVVDIEQIVRAIGVKEENVRVVDPYDLTETQEAVKKAYEASEPFVIIAKRPCALIKEVQKMRASLKCTINQDKCTNCKMCLRIGCPAIAFKDDVMVVDQASCNGCTLCMQVCRFDAIERSGE
jgi:indolepyruvate ferredoxin oxidoreductase alpha subunit